MADNRIDLNRAEEDELTSLPGVDAEVAERIISHPSARWRSLRRDPGRADRAAGLFAYNDFGEPRYDGPRPPEGHGPDTYRLRLAALDVQHMALPDRPTVADLRQAMKEHAIAEAEVTGIYER